MALCRSRGWRRFRWDLLKTHCSACHKGLGRAPLAPPPWMTRPVGPMPSSPSMWKRARKMMRESGWDVFLSAGRGRAWEVTTAVYQTVHCGYMFHFCKRFWSWLPLRTATCPHSVLYNMLFFWHLHAENPAKQTQDSCLSHFFLLWTPYLEFTPARSLTLLSPVIF